MPVLEKLHHCSSIGTFAFTVVLVVLAVIPMLPHADTGKSGATQEQTGGPPMTGWIPASALAAAIIVSAILNFAAMRTNRQGSAAGAEHGSTEGMAISPTSPELLRSQIADLAATFIAILIKHDYEIEPSEGYTNDHGGGLKKALDRPLPDAAIEAAFSEGRFNDRLSSIKAALGDRGLLKEKIGQLSIRTLIERDAHNAADLQDIIRGLRHAVITINREFSLLPVGRHSLDLSAREREWRLIKEDLNRSESRLAIANKQLETWPKVWPIYAAAEEAGRLSRVLMHMLEVSRLPGREAFAQLLSTPLSPVPLDSFAYVFEKRKFQEDILILEGRLPNTPKVTLSTCPYPSNLKPEDVIALLKKNHEELTAQAASMLG